MKIKSLLLAALALGLTSNALAQGTTAFTYQGRLNGSGGPVTGSYDLKFAVYDAVASGNAVSSVLTNTATTVTNGLFTLTLDFGSGVFTGSARWLDLAVRTNGNGAFTALAPRQPLTPAPYALFAPTAGVAATAASASSVANNGVSGPAIAAGQVVKSLNGLHDAVTLAPGANVSLVTNGNALTISAAGGGTNGGWATTGNTGTMPTVHFLGTTDGQPLVVKANNVGINTNNPQAALHVNGTVLATRFAGDGSGLTNVPAAPFTCKNLAIAYDGGFALGVAVAGHYAYLANGYDGLEVYDISDPAHPVNVGHNVFGWDANAVAISGHTAFVASDTLYAVDISSPANPVAVGKASGSYQCYGVAVAATTAYLAADTDGLFIYNVANPTNPVSRGHIDNGGRAWGVAVSGNFAYLANDTDGLRVYNVANPAAPVNISHINTSGLTRGVAVSGNFAYLANNDDGLRIYNISNPTNPISVGHIYEAGYAYGVAVSGRYAFVANYNDGLRVYDVSDPAHPSGVGAVPISGDGFALAVATSGNYAYAANDTGGLATYFAAPLATVPGVISASGFVGDGSSLTNLPAGQLTGTIPAVSIVDNSITAAKLAPNSVTGAALADAIALGTSSADGQLDVYGTAIGTPGISLFGSSSQISTYGNDGKEQIRLWGAGYGELLLHNSLDNNNTAVLLTANGASGGLLRLNDTDNSPRAQLAGFNTGGELNLWDGNGISTLHLPSQGDGFFLGGKLGLGTDTAEEMLDVAGNAAVSGSLFVDSKEANSGTDRPGLVLGGSGSGESVSSQRTSGGPNQFGIDFYTTYRPRLSIANNGSVGIGTQTPTDALLDVQGSIRLNKNDLFLATGTDRGHGLGYRSYLQGRKIDGPFLYGYYGGSLGASGPDTAIFTWNWVGDAWLSNNLSVASITVRNGADVAEPFPMSATNLAPGSVVIIDEDHPGQLKLSESAYDTRVAGIISGANGINPGIALQQADALGGGQNVALSGRVYVLADASKTPIKPGDLLTTSDNPGHAMKVTDPARGTGAILGKAMTPLKKGRGFVLVLVSLQ